MSLTRAIPTTVKELRLHLCQKSQSSQGLRYVPPPPRNDLRARSRFRLAPNASLKPSQFILSTYPQLRSSNPNLKIMIREASGVEPKAFVRFGESGRAYTAPMEDG